jgi:hypothetical protein
VWILQRHMPLYLMLSTEIVFVVVGGLQEVSSLSPDEAALRIQAQARRREAAKRVEAIKRDRAAAKAASPTAAAAPAAAPSVRCQRPPPT